VSAIHKIPFDGELITGEAVRLGLLPYCRDPARLVTTRLSNARVSFATTVPIVGCSDESLFISCCCNVK